MNTAVISTTIRFNRIPVSFRTTPDQKRATKVRPYIRLRWSEQVVDKQFHQLPN
ncbi:hypothetical protein DPMN_117438 [Dreissena polymorpha]|uniref:Uncharacterized protein n=1 Tax=Dreissena polymorpha TaxID=45954 RepID=A0A9D4KQW9_DREPO|nr:hypothetical protein DPMN_117438 [Dreissena polymorpha]